MKLITQTQIIRTQSTREMMKEKFLSSNVFTVTQKDSPYTETINIW